MRSRTTWASATMPPEVQALNTQEVAEAAKVHQANKTPKAKAKRKAKGNGEVTKLQLRQFAKQLHHAKMDEFKSYQEETMSVRITDMRKHHCRNYVTGRWVLTIKRDTDGNFEKCQARWSYEVSWTNKAAQYKAQLLVNKI